MNNKYLLTLTLLILIGTALPTSAATDPGRAKATATVFARVLQPASLTISQELRNNRLIPAVKVSSAQKLAYQLQVNHKAIQSYQQSTEQLSRSFATAMHKTSANTPDTLTVTLNFN